MTIKHPEKGPLASITVALTAMGLLIATLWPAPSPNEALAKKSGSNKKKTKLKVVVIAKPNHWKTASEVATAVSKKFRSKGRLPAVPTVKKVDKTDKIYQSFRLEGIKGIKAFKKMSFKKAIGHLKQAVDRLERLMAKYGPSLFLIRKMVNAQYYLGACHLGEGDAPAARRAFLVAASYDPNGSPQPNRFSPDVIKAYQEALKARDSNISMVIIRANDSTRLFVDGHDYGSVPQTLKKIPMGRHFFLLYRMGYLRVAKFLDVDTPTGTTWKVNISPDPEQPNTPAFISAVDREMRTKRMAGPWIAKVAKRLGTEQVVVCRASVNDAEASWYDAKKKRFIKRVRRANPVPGKAASDDIADSLFTKKPVYDLGTQLVAKCVSDADCPEGQCVSGKCIVSTPFYKKWWFWVAVGVSAAAAAAAGAVVGTMPEKPILRIGRPD